MTNSYLPRIELGASYYPEHWPEERWPEDIHLMRDAGLTVVRMAEFAWSTLEPIMGEFHFEWLDRAIDLLASNGIHSVLGTPTAAPPAWLVEQYPQILAVDENGRQVQFGNRCHYCVNSEDFHNAVSRLVSAMAAHFGSNSHIIGWQIDNEYNRVCYCDHCRERFQQHLAQQYETLEILNQRWTTRYWSQTYSAWDQIPIPIGYHNPGLMLEFKRFVTQSYCKFQRLQVDELRPHLAPGVWITHNFMGWFDGFDHYQVSADLDMASWDWYVYNGHHDYLTSGATHDLTRGFKRKNFWLIETQPGNVHWTPVNSTLDKGEARAMAWQAVAHGADGVAYWQWRSAYGGQEQYHGTVVEPSGQPRPFYEELQQIGAELATISPLITGSNPKANVAMVNDYDSRWSIRFQPHHKDFDYVTHFNHYYRALAARNIGVEILPVGAIIGTRDLPKYKIVFAPALIIVDDEIAASFRDFVNRGGHLVLTIRSGMKNRYNALLPFRQPGPLAEIAGIEVEDYYALRDPIPVVGNWFEGVSHIWAERLKLRQGATTQVIARYGKSNGWLDDQIAISVNAYGKGLVYYIGAYLDPVAQQSLVDKVLKNAEIRSLSTPTGVEARVRVRPDGEEIYFMINHISEEQSITLPWSAYDHLRGEPIGAELPLLPYGVAVLTRIGQVNKPSDAFMPR